MIFNFPSKMWVRVRSEAPRNRGTQRLTSTNRHSDPPHGGECGVRGEGSSAALLTSGRSVLGDWLSAEPPGERPAHLRGRPGGQKKANHEISRRTVRKQAASAGSEGYRSRRPLPCPEYRR